MGAGGGADIRLYISIKKTVFLTGLLPISCSCLSMSYDEIQAHMGTCTRSVPHRVSVSAFTGNITNMCYMHAKATVMGPWVTGLSRSRATPTTLHSGGRSVSQPRGTRLTVSRMASGAEIQSRWRSARQIATELGATTTRGSCRDAPDSAPGLEPTRPWPWLSLYSWQARSWR